MTETPDRLRFIASYVAGRALDVSQAPAGEAAYTNGRAVFVSAEAGLATQRREMLVQSALLGAGSLDPRLVKALRARPTVARRYLALEGDRVLAELATRLPLAATLRPAVPPRTASADESLRAARSRADVVGPPGAPVPGSRPVVGVATSPFRLPLPLRRSMVGPASQIGVPPIA